MSITKYAILRRKRYSHNLATTVSGVDWKALGMGVYRGSIVILAWTALIGALNLVERLLDEREQAEAQATEYRKVEAEAIKLLNGERAAFIHRDWNTVRWIGNCERFEVGVPESERVI